LESCAILFVKNPQAGTVKTRLQTVCTPDEAAAIYRAFVLDSAATLAACSATRKVVAYAPAGAGEDIARLLGDGPWELVPQPETDLGGRMDGMLRWSFAQGSRRTVIIGSDSPSLPVLLVDEALDKLGHCDLVVGPSTDGGYYLVGQSKADSAPFVGIEWSSGRVLEQTLAACRHLRLRLLVPWYDVDTPAEAAFLRVHLRALRQAGEAGDTRSLEVLEGVELPPPS
jgi:uncharacterized protein